jgi:hypothetical protein
MESGGKAVRILFAVQTYCDPIALCKKMSVPLTDEFDICKSIEDYEALTDKYSYDLIVVLFGGFVV